MAESPRVAMKTAPPIVSDMTCFQRPMIRMTHCHVYWDNSRSPKRYHSPTKARFELYHHVNALSVSLGGREATPVIIYSPGSVCFFVLIVAEEASRQHVEAKGQGAPVSHTHKTVRVWMWQTSSRGHGQMTSPGPFPDK